MSRLTQFLFPAPAPRSAGAIVRWWERRRLSYNLAVGGAGLVTLTVVHLVVALPPYGSRLFGAPVLLIVAAYGALANLFYTLGWVVEGALHAAWGERVLPTGGALFRHGLVFSVGLTLFPAVLAGLHWCARIAAWLMR